MRIPIVAVMSLTLVSTRTARADLTGGGGFAGLAWNENNSDFHPSLALEQKFGLSYGHVGLHLFTNLTLGNWKTAGNAYGWLYDHSHSYDARYEGLVWMALGMGYLTAWLAATNLTMTGPMVTLYPRGQRSDRSDLSIDAGIGPAIVIDEIHDRGLIGVGVTAGGSLPITDNLSLGSRLYVVPASQPVAFAASILLIL